MGVRVGGRSPVIGAFPITALTIEAVRVHDAGPVCGKIECREMERARGLTQVGIPHDFHQLPGERISMFVHRVRHMFDLELILCIDPYRRSFGHFRRELGSL